MGLLDGILGQVLSAGAAKPTPHDNDLMSGVLQMLGSSQSGGFGGLVRQFEQAGLSHLIQGWINTGPNPAATPQQIEKGLGQANLMALAQKLGISPQMVAGQLAHLLPVLIDKLTPDGAPPQQSALEQAVSGLGGLSGLASMLGGGKK